MIPNRDQAPGSTRSGSRHAATRQQTSALGKNSVERNLLTRNAGDAFILRGYDDKLTTINIVPQKSVDSCGTMILNSVYYILCFHRELVIHPKKTNTKKSSHMVVRT